MFLNLPLQFNRIKPGRDGNPSILIERQYALTYNNEKSSLNLQQLKGSNSNLIEIYISLYELCLACIA